MEPIVDHSVGSNNTGHSTSSNLVHEYGLHTSADGLLPGLPVDISHMYPRRLRKQYEPTSRALGAGEYGQVEVFTVNDSPDSFNDLVGRVSSAGTDSNLSNASVGDYVVDESLSVAIKSMPRFGQHSLVEPALLRVLHPHPYIINLLDIHTSPLEMSISVDLVLQLGDSNLYNDGEYAPFVTLNPAKYLAQMCHGVRHCHNFHICHGDIKPENFIYFAREDRIKLADLGIAQHVACRALSARMGDRLYADNYRPPEGWFGYDDFNLSGDIWALAVTFFEIYSSYVLFNFSDAVDNDCVNLEDVLSIIARVVPVQSSDFVGLHLHFRDDFDLAAPLVAPSTVPLNVYIPDSQLLDLLYKMLVADPRNRLLDPLSHPYLHAHSSIHTCPQSMIKLIPAVVTPLSVGAASIRRKHLDAMLAVFLHYYNNMPGIYHLAVNIYDRMRDGAAAHYEMTEVDGQACLFIAQLYLWSVHQINEFCSILLHKTGLSISCSQLTNATTRVLAVVNWRLCVTTPYDILLYEMTTARMSKVIRERVNVLLCNCSWVPEVYRKPPLELVREVILYVTQRRFADTYDPISQLRHLPPVASRIRVVYQR